MAGNEASIHPLLRTITLREKNKMRLSKTLQYVVLSSVCAFSALPAQAATNLLVNGGFEYPANFPNTLVSGGNTIISGWITTGSGVHWMNENLGFFTDPSGIYAVDLANYAKANGGIKQSFVTTIGALYSVSFAGMTYQNTGGNPDGLGEITALIDDVEIQTYQLVNKSSASNAWQNFSFNFTATSALTTLEFVHKPAGENYSFLNDAGVFAVSVPEPESWAMLLAGLGLVGFAARRRTAS